MLGPYYKNTYDHLPGYEPSYSYFKKPDYSFLDGKKGKGFIDLIYEKPEKKDISLKGMFNKNLETAGKVLPGVEEFSSTYKTVS